MTTLILNLGQQLSAPAANNAPPQRARTYLLWLSALAALAAFFWLTRDSLKPGWIAGVSVAAATAIGALPVAFARRMPEKLASGLMMAGGGIMATVTLSGVLPEAFAGMQKIVQRMRKEIGLPVEFTLDACRHGGMTELEEAELTEGQGRALSAHRTKESYAGYAKRTEARMLSATRKRHAHALANQMATSVQNASGHGVQNEIPIIRKVLDL